MSIRKKRRKTRIIFLPFIALWRLANVIKKLLGKKNTVILGIVMIVLGMILNMSMFGTIVGIPAMIMGVMLLFSAQR